MSRAVPFGEPHEPHCQLCWTPDGICNCGPEGKRMQTQWRIDIAAKCPHGRSVGLYCRDCEDGATKGAK